MATTAASSTGRDKTLIDIGDEWKDTKDKWLSSIRGADGCIYGIPNNANRVVRFDPATKILTSIGMDLGNDGMKWWCGVLADNGFVYSAPNHAEKILKINTNPGASADTAVSTIDLPDGVDASSKYKWGVSGDKAADGTLYFMPATFSHILRIDPNDNDSVTLVGDGNDAGKYSGTVATPDGFVYGIPHSSKQIIKFDSANPDTTISVGKEAEKDFYCEQGVLANDGNIYALSHGFGGILKINASDDTYSIVKLDFFAEKGGLGSPIQGRDDRLYFPPKESTRVMVFDTNTQEASLVGPIYSPNRTKWHSGALASDGAIYCLPSNANRILKMDPSVLKVISEIRSQEIHGDTDRGIDRLGLRIIARALAAMLLHKNMKGPFVLGVLGRWGRGKSFFFNLIVEEMIKIQRKPVASFKEHYAGHIYKVHFNAWTFHKEDLWASIMYQILEDLNDQLRLEHLMLDVRSDDVYALPLGREWLKNGAFSTLAIMRNLNKNELDNLDLQLSENPTEFSKHLNESWMKVLNQKGETSEALVNAMDHQYKDDKKKEKNLERKIGKLIAKKREEVKETEKKKNMKKFWERVKNHSQQNGYALFKLALTNYQDKKKKEKEKGKKNGDGVDEEHRPLLGDTNADPDDTDDEPGETGDDPEDNNDYPEDIQTALKTLGKVQKLIHYFRTSDFPIHAWIVLILMIIIPIAFFRYFDINPSINKIVEIATPIISGSVAAYSKISKGLKTVDEISDKLNSEIAQIQNDIDSRDVKEARDGKEDDGEIGRYEQKLAKIQNRLKLKKGESLREAVLGTDSGIYSKRLGIVHNVQQDLKRLSASMLNKKREDYDEVFPRGDPRIVLFVDDLDRCEPEKVVEVIEALQILVKEPIFKVILAIDPRYVCLALEKDKAGILDKKQDGAPSGMDYLEKIIQIPFRLPVVDGQNFDTYVKNMMDVEEEIKGKSPKENKSTGREEKDKKPGQADIISDAVEGKSEVEEDQTVVENHDSLAIPDLHVKFSKDDLNMIQRQGKIFNLAPRTIKRIVNVFKVMKFIWALEGEDDDAKFREASLLLLFLASDDWARKHTSKILKWMESSTMSYSKEQALKADPDNNLAKVLLGLLGLTSSEDDGTIENHIREVFECYKWKNVSGWKKVSMKFCLARSFSFSDYTMAFEDEEDR